MPFAIDPDEEAMLNMSRTCLSDTVKEVFRARPFTPPGTSVTNAESVPRNADSAEGTE